VPLRLLVLKDAGGDPPTYLNALHAPSGIEIKIRGWESFSSQELDPQVELVLIHAAPKAEKADPFFHWMRDNPLPTPILAVLPDGSAEFVREVARMVDDFMLDPPRPEELDLRIANLLEGGCSQRKQFHVALEDELGLAQMVGKHPSFQQAVQQIRLFGTSDASILISGETGTGKELFAHAIHSLSQARKGPFIPVDCGALPDHLAENELFGHRRGAFTDAHSDQKGLAAMAEGGTLFLDEIDSLSLASQAKLLRFLQERSYRALGADRYTRANVRVIAATNRCIEEAVRRKEFRNDLYFRLSVLRLNLPSLRERRGDVSLLALHFLANECPKRKTLSPAALRKLENHTWPGNVRELFNTMQRAIVCVPGPQILPEHLFFNPDVVAAISAGAPAAKGDLKSAKRQMIEQFERSYIEQLLARHQGNVTRAACEAGKERRAFGKLVKKYGINGQGAGLGLF
jgi:DNA-binding NtrC family response regulator